MTAAVLDISMPLRPGTPRFPDDPPFEIDVVSAPGPEGGYGLSRLRLGSHTGTHIDPPSHFVPGRATVDELDPEALMGPCVVVSVADDRRYISTADLPAPAAPPRWLFRTRNSARWSSGADYFPDYVGVTAEAARTMVERKVRLVGIDALSVENDPTGRYPVHRTLLAAGVVVLEGLLLGAVDPGDYELLCLPLRIERGDGAPARALLRTR